MLEVRITDPELLDATDCDSQLASSSYKFMQLVNRFFGGTPAVKNFLAEEISKRDHSRPVRVLDIGSGTCDIPLAITDWAHKQSQRIEFTCLEINETALKTAAENTRKSGYDSIKLKHEDVFEFRPREHFDYAVGSMFFHHFQDDHILQIIEKLRSYVLKGILINDLWRNPISYMGCFVLVCLLSKGVKHDALLSIRKGFRPDELRRLLSRIDRADVRIKVQNFSRLTAAVRFD